MTILGIAICFALMLGGLALLANSRFRDQDRLPMQWWVTGEVTWSAPRVVALAFVPALAIGILMISVALVFDLRPRPGQEGAVLPAFVALGALFVGTQLLHLWLIKKTLGRNGS